MSGAGQPTAIVLRTAGTNCDLETLRALRLAGARTSHLHVDQLVARPQLLEEADIVAFPGGFSYGDDIASGRVLAARLRRRLWPALRRARDRGALMLGVCNGFQVLVQLGLLPGGDGDGPPAPTTALVDNATGRFVDAWVRVRFEPDSRCLWTKGLAEALAGLGEAQRKEAATLPIAHGEGRFVAHSEAVLDALEARGQVPIRYVDNVNGSARSIAGVCDPSGRVFGLMPHPERFLEWSRHPRWTSLDAALLEQETIGMRIFRNAVEAASRAGLAASP